MRRRGADRQSVQSPRREVDIRGIAVRPFRSVECALPVIGTMRRVATASPISLTVIAVPGCTV